MKNNKGITLVSLIITIIILLILASIATYSGMDAVKSSKYTKFVAQLKIMQTQVNEIYQKYKSNDTIQIDGTTYGGTENNTILEIGQEPTQEQKNLLNTLVNDTTSGVKSSDRYKYWNQNLIKSLNIEGVEQDLLINIENRSVVSCEGLEYEGKTYYTLNQIPNGLYNIEYENPNQGKPTFNVYQEALSNNEWKISISDIHYTEGYINKWQIKYKLEDEDNWNTTEDLSFIVNKPGIYHIFLINGGIESDEQIITIDEVIEISSIEDLEKIQNNLEGKYKLITDLNFLNRYSYETEERYNYYNQEQHRLDTNRKR